MDRQERLDLILDHYDHPRHRGALAPADVVLGGENSGCGDAITVYLRVDDDGGCVSLAFDGEGCTISQAAASMVMEMMNAWSVDQIKDASVQPILDKLGPDIASARLRCATLAFHTVKEAARTYRRNSALHTEGKRPQA